MAVKIDTSMAGNTVQSKQDNSSGSSLDKDAFLKLLDGSIIDDAFVVMTTNHIEKLDPALTRSGRINMTYFMDNLERPEAEAMCKLYDLDPDKILEGETFPINPAYLTDKCISEYK